VSHLDEYQLPPLPESSFAGVRRFRKSHPEACMLVEIVTLMQALCGFILSMDDFFLALYDAPEIISRTLARIADWVIEITRLAAAAGADVVQLADDYGSTGRALIAPAMWRTLIFPHLQRIVDAAHECGVPLLLHSCGYQMDFLEDYVAAGIDVLQSFQPKAGNDLEGAYAHYGDHYAFATGIDTQQGEWMSPAELREDILWRYAIGRSKPRFILGMTHMMQYTMPPENVRTILQTVKEIQSGMHD
jgi:uroporphyrinogen decarboxylase